MTRTQARALVRRINKKGGDAKFRESYSGRGMFGRTTCAVVCGPYDIDRVRTKFSLDSMGFSIIVY